MERKFQKLIILSKENSNDQEPEDYKMDDRMMQLYNVITLF